MKIVQRRLPPEVWIQHFREQANGVRHPTRDGYIFVTNQKGQGSGSSKLNPIRLVSPVQQVVDQAKSQIKREGKVKKKEVNSYCPSAK